MSDPLEALKLAPVARPGDPALVADALGEALAGSALDPAQFVAIERRWSDKRSPHAGLSILKALAHAPCLREGDAVLVPLGEVAVDPNEQVVTIFVSEDGAVWRRVEPGSSRCRRCADDVAGFLGALAREVWATGRRYRLEVGASWEAIADVLESFESVSDTVRERGGVVAVDGRLLGGERHREVTFHTDDHAALLQLLEAFSAADPLVALRVVSSDAVEEETSPPCPSTEAPDGAFPLSSARGRGYVWRDGQAIEQVWIRGEQLDRWETIRSDGVEAVQFGVLPSTTLSGLVSTSAEAVFAEWGWRRDVSRALEPSELRGALRARRFPVFQAAVELEAALGGLRWQRDRYLGVGLALAETPEVEPFPDAALVPLFVGQRTSSLWLDETGALHLRDVTGVAQGGPVSRSWRSHLERLAAQQQVKERFENAPLAMVDALVGDVVASLLGLALHREASDGLTDLWSGPAAVVTQRREVLDYWEDMTVVRCREVEVLIEVLVAIHELLPEHLVEVRNVKLGQRPTGPVVATIGRRSREQRRREGTLVVIGPPGARKLVAVS